MASRLVKGPFSFEKTHVLRLELSISQVNKETVTLDKLVLQ